MTSSRGGGSGKIKKREGRRGKKRGKKRGRKKEEKKKGKATAPIVMVETVSPKPAPLLIGTKPAPVTRKLLVNWQSDWGFH